ncbi:MAG: class I adenylate-forming enzyme family protein [Candidatus Binatia bacterium]
MIKLGDLLLGACRAFPQKPAIVYREETLTYAAYQRLICRVAGLLARAGLGPGDRIAVISRNVPEYLIVFGAAEMAGFVVVPVNFRLAAEEMLYILQDSGARAVFVEDGAPGEVVQEVRERALGIGLWVVWRGDRLKGYVRWPDWLESGEADLPGWPVGGEQAAYIFYTSGTTGRPKGAVLPHQRQVANVLVMAAELSISREEKVLLVMPLHHVGGKWMSLVTLVRGATLVVHPAFDLEAVVRTVSQHGITLTLMAPTMIYRILKTEGLDLNRLRSLQTVLYSSAPMAPSLLEEGLRVFGSVFAQVYGSTESGCVTWFSKNEHHAAVSSGEYGRLASAGHPVLGADLLVVGKDDHDLDRGREGEVCVRAPWVFSGYWRNEEATRSAFLKGWLRMGDIGRIDHEGYVYILDRKNDLIISGGENVYPHEVEGVLLSHPEVEEAAVVGVPDMEWGERVKAFVVVREGARLRPDEAVEFCRGRIAGHKRPREVQLVKDLPKNSVGKVLRRQLRDSGEVQRRPDF